MNALRNLTPGVDNFAKGENFSRGAFFWKALGVVVLAVLLARWTWIWFAPQAPSVIALPDVASAEETGHLFGVIVAAAEPTMPQVNLNLIGVFAGRKGFALFRVDGNRQLGVPVGGEISPGMKLLEAEKDHVIVGMSGARQRINLSGAAPKR